jgi:hypothetical protein
VERQDEKTDRFFAGIDNLRGLSVGDGGGNRKG